MREGSKLKRLVRQRMAETGERYCVARSALLAVEKARVEAYEKGRPPFRTRRAPSEVYTSCIISDDGYVREGFSHVLRRLATKQQTEALRPISASAGYHAANGADK